VTGVQTCALPIFEAYYGQYFKNRAKVVAYSEQYEHAFTDRKNQIAAYEAQLASLKQQIRSEKRRLGKECKILWATGTEKEKKKVFQI